MAFLGLARPFSIGKYAHNGVDYISDLLGELLFLWRLLLTLLLLVSLSTSVFRSVSSSVFFRSLIGNFLSFFFLLSLAL